MSAAVQPMTLDQFLAWERRQDLRWEFDGVGAVAMTGGTIGHSIIATNLAILLGERLAAGSCRALRGDVKILVAGRVRYPDVVVTCTPAPPTADIAPEPVVVFEVISPSTARTDRVAKFAEYRATPSIQHYVLVEQSEMAATVLSRQGEQWITDLVRGDAILALPAIDVALPLPSLYRGVELAADDD